MVTIANTVLVVLSLLLGGRLLFHYARRPRPHSLWYGVGLILIACAAFPELYFELTGQIPTALWWLYWSTASGCVAYLSVGSAYLLHQRFGQVSLAVMVALTVWVAAATLLTGGTGPAVVATEAFRSAPTAAIKLPFLLQNIGGSLIILAGALISFVRTRAAFTLLIALGTFVFASGGAAAGLMEFSQIFAFTQTAGILLLYAGVSLSLRPRKAVSQPSTVPSR
ncbi:MAG: hypothetical protein AB2385_06675 [Symbiobacterium sp.]|jgi:hypothetical protein|uniref:hypothetical protein n=1 Tax=Symbiobacterium sp. TaxID=1971213 RepID=UPI003463E0D4